MRKTKVLNTFFSLVLMVNSALRNPRPLRLVEKPDMRKTSAQQDQGRAYLNKLDTHMTTGVDGMHPQILRAY